MKRFDLFNKMDVPNRNGHLYKYEDFLKFDGQEVYVLSSMSNLTKLFDINKIVGHGVIVCEDNIVKCDFHPFTKTGETLQEYYSLRTATVCKVHKNHCFPTKLLYVAFTHDPA